MRSDLFNFVSQFCGSVVLSLSLGIMTLAHGVTVSIRSVANTSERIWGAVDYVRTVPLALLRRADVLRLRRTKGLKV